MVGASSSDIKSKGRIEVVGENRVLDRHWRMESLAKIEPLPVIESANDDPGSEDF